MDFSLQTVFVIPTGEARVTTGNTSALAGGDWGFFGQDLAAINAPSTTSRVRVVMGRFDGEATKISKKSDVMEPTKIIEFYKRPAITTRQEKIVTISNVNVRCGEDVTVTLRAFSQYLNVSYTNGLTRSFTALAPCCDCGDEPCTAVDDEALIDDLVAQINAYDGYKGFIVASKGGTSGAWTLVLTGQVPPAVTNSANPVYDQYDGQDYVDFYAYAYQGAATTWDELVSNRCRVVAEVATTQEASFVTGTSEEVKLVEWQNYSYQTPKFKSTFKEPEYNIGFVSNVADNAFYHEYVVRYYNMEDGRGWEPTITEDETVRIFVNTADTTIVTNIESFFNTWLGAGAVTNGIHRER